MQQPKHTFEITLFVNFRTLWRVINKSDWLIRIIVYTFCLLFVSFYWFIRIIMIIAVWKVEEQYWNCLGWVRDHHEEMMKMSGAHLKFVCQGCRLLRSFSWLTWRFTWHERKERWRWWNPFFRLLLCKKNLYHHNLLQSELSIVLGRVRYPKKSRLQEALWYTLQK